MHSRLSIILPARNESQSLATLLPDLKRRHPSAEIIVVDDGSDDATPQVAREQGARVVSHMQSRGNGAAIKSGARAAGGDILVFMDADGQHDPADVERLVSHLAEGHDLVVGARSADSHAAPWRRFGNWIYNRLAGWVVGRKIPDLTSGFRAVRADKFRQILHLLPNGFSYPTTSTMAFFRCGYGTAFVPIRAAPRANNKSHVRLLRDGGRFLLIIFRIGTLYSPLKLFFPISLFFFLSGLGYCAYTLVEFGRFTNFGALLFVTALLVFLIGLVSEQITALLFSQNQTR